MLIKKDFEAVAEIIRHMTASTSLDEQAAAIPIANELADYFATQSSRFDREQFMMACGLGDEE